jgi:hypothetical protein
MYRYTAAKSFTTPFTAVSSLAYYLVLEDAQCRTVPGQRSANSVVDSQHNLVARHPHAPSVSAGLLACRTSTGIEAPICVLLVF